MNRSLTVSLVITTLLVLFCGCSVRREIPGNVDDWYQHRDGNLQVKMPFKPRVHSRSLTHPQMGQLSIKFYVCELNGKTGFAVSQIKYPVSPRAYNVAAGLKGAVVGMAREVDGDLSSEIAVSHNGIAGKEVVVSKADGLNSRARIYIDGNGPTLYQFQAIGDRKFIQQAVVEEFFNSIRLTPVGQNNDPKTSKSTLEN